MPLFCKQESLDEFRTYDRHVGVLKPSFAAEATEDYTFHGQRPCHPGSLQGKISNTNIVIYQKKKKKHRRHSHLIAAQSQGGVTRKGC